MCVCVRVCAFDWMHSDRHDKRRVLNHAIHLSIIPHTVIHTKLKCCLILYNYVLLVVTKYPTWACALLYSIIVP